MPNGADVPRAASKSGMPSIISADLKVTGNLYSGGDLQIEGAVEGDIESRSLTIGEAAQVRGSISAESVRICGSVTGQVKATSVTLAKSAKVVGDILHQSLAIEQGAFIDGHCRRIEPGVSPGDAKAAAARDKASTPLPEHKTAAAGSGLGGSSGIVRAAANEVGSR